MHIFLKNTAVFVPYRVKPATVLLVILIVLFLNERGKL